MGNLTAWGNEVLLLVQNHFKVCKDSTKRALTALNFLFCTNKYCKIWKHFKVFFRVKPCWGLESNGNILQTMRSEDYLSFHLKPLNADADSEEDAEGKTDVTDTLGYGVDDGEDMVSPAKSNGGDEEVTEKEDEISNAETGKEMIENVVHLSENVNIPRHVQDPPPCTLI